MLDREADMLTAAESDRGSQARLELPICSKGRPGPLGCHVNDQTCLAELLRRFIDVRPMKCLTCAQDNTQVTGMITVIIVLILPGSPDGLEGRSLSSL